MRRLLSRRNGLIICVILDIARRNLRGVLLKENARLTRLLNLKKRKIYKLENSAKDSLYAHEKLKDSESG